MILCPTPAELEAAFAGLVANSAQHSDFVDHVAECTQCQAVLEALLAGPWYPQSGNVPADGSHQTPATVVPDPQRQERTESNPQVAGFEMLERLGRGGMGVVFKARHLQLNRLVALKMIRADNPSTEQRSRFQVEAQAIARLHHPNIVQVFEVVEHDGLPCLALELVEGGTLAERLNHKPLSPRQAATLLVALARAMHTAHTAGIIHRDLKPSNVLIAADGTPKITDFGLARKLDEAAGPTLSGQIMGTPEYMAPEQASGKTDQVGTLSDVYALGAILYECLTGRPPFRAATPLETLAQVVDQEPVAPRTLNVAVPRDLEVICLKCLQKEPHRRYESAQTLAEDAERFLAGQPIRARPVGAGERALKWARRNRAVAGLSVAVVLVFLLGSAASLWFGLDAAHQAGEATLAAGREKLKAAEAASQALRADRAAEAARNASIEAKENEKTAKKNEAAARDEAYRANLALSAMKLTAALREWQKNNLVLAEEILAEVPAEFQHTWEYRHLRQLCRRKGLRLEGEQDARAVAFSPDGRSVVTGCMGGVLKVHDAASGRLLMTLNGHQDEVSSVAYSPCGERIASAGWERTIRIWDARSGANLLALEGHPSSGIRVSYSPDGLFLVSHDGGNPTLRVWDGRNGMERRPFRGHTGPVLSMAFSADGTRIVTGSTDLTQKIWDVRTRQPLRTMKSQRIDQGNSAECVGYSPDAARVFSTSTRRTQVWDAQTRQPLLTIDGPMGVETYTMAINPDGGSIVTGGQGMLLRVWDTREGKEQLTFQKHGNQTLALAYSWDGGRIAAASTDKPVRVWDTRATQALLTLRGHTDRVFTVAASPDGKYIASAGADAVVEVRDGQTGWLRHSLRGHTGQLMAVACSPDGLRLASGGGDNQLKIWGVQTGKEERTIGHASRVNGIAYSPDGSRFVVGCSDSTLRVRDATTGNELLTLQGQPGASSGPIRTVAYSPDGGSIASGGDAGARIWDATTGKERIVLREAKEVFCVAFSPDGARLVTTSGDKTLKVWDTATGKGLLVLTGHRDLVYGVAYSPDGSRIVSGSYDNTLKVWDSRTGQEMLTLEGHTTHARGVAFSADGARIISGSFDRTVKIWDAGSDATQRYLKGHLHPVKHLAASKDGKRLFASDVSGKILSWDVETGRLLADSPATRPADMSAAGACVCGKYRATVVGNLIRIDRTLQGEYLREYHQEEAQIEKQRHAIWAHAHHVGAIPPALARKDFTAAIFHLDRLIGLAPTWRPRLLQDRAGILSNALKANPGNAYFAQTLARQAIANPETIPDKQALLKTLASLPTAPLDRLHGALLLRTGNAADAALVLRAAIAHRWRDEPPIDELLLCHALIALNRHDEARQMLSKAVLWMDGISPQKQFGAAMGVTHPLATVVPLGVLSVISQPSGRRLPVHDAFNAQELSVLRREAELALSKLSG